MKLLLQILLIITIVSTFTVCAIKPDMHKNVVVYDSAYTLVTEEEVKTQTKDIPVIDMPSKPIEKTTAISKKVEPITQTQNVQTTNKKKQVQTKSNQTPNIKQTVAKSQPKTVSPSVTTKVSKPVVTEEKKTEAPKFEQKSIPINQPVITPKVLTQQEETIAWNKWRSNLTNQIMKDTKLPDIPNGTLFQFSFTVDKYGKITNVQTGANPAAYTPYAIQYIAPVIRSYQGRSILNFPEGTSRVSTQVTGKWRISNTEKYSTPQDYNDVEKVIKY